MLRYSYMNIVRLGLILLCLILTGCGEAPLPVTQSPTLPPSPTVAAESLASKIAKVMNSFMESESFSGAVLIARNGEVLISQGYGLADREKNLPNTPLTKYRIGSITKQFTAMAILMLQVQGKLNVQDPVCLYISDCPAAWQGITIHHLLTHTSGIPNFTNFPDYQATKARPSSPEQTIARFKDQPLDFPAGTQWSYSNSGYILLGYIIEQVSDQSYEMFLQQNIFEPLQMKDTGYDHNDGSGAIGYTGIHDLWAEADFIDMTIPYAAGGLYSTVEDLYRWDQALYTGQLVPKDLLDSMFTPHAKMPDPGLSYGYGWFVGEMNNHKAVSHGGSIEGFATEFRRYIDDKVTIIVLSNRYTTDVVYTADQIARAVFEEQ